MNKKRIAALIAASTLLLSTTTVFADETASTGSTTITGSSTVGAYDSSAIYVVTLPTENALNFTVDPYGLLDLASGGAVSLATIKEQGNGSILTSSGSGAYLRNMSSEDIVITVKANVAVSGSATVVTTPDDVTGSATNMFVALVPSSTKIKLASGASVSEGYSPAEQAIALTTTSTEVAKFRLNAAAYEVVKDASGFTMKLETKTADNYDATQLNVGGIANSKGDWADFAAGKGSTIKLNAVFSYAKAAAEVRADDVAYGLVSGSATTMVEFDGAAGSGTELGLKGTGLTKTDSGYTLTYTKGSSVSFTASNATITAVGYSDSASGSPSTASYLTVATDGKSFTINNAWTGASAGAKKYVTVTMKDKDNNTIKKVITVTIATS